jgi:shikimate kinase
MRLKEIAMYKSNIVLIGMPSSGKTTAGQLLAEITDKAFLDTDSVIRAKAGMPLKEIVEKKGLTAFLALQEETVLKLEPCNHVIATGGGMVHSDKAMRHLKGNGTVVFLKEAYEEIVKRITPGRRFARNEGQTLRELFDERMPLYEKYADIVVECSGREACEIVRDIADRLRGGNAAW